MVAPGCQLALALGLQHHGHADPVLHAAAGVARLQLGQQAHAAGPGRCGPAPPAACRRRCRRTRGGDVLISRSPPGRSSPPQVGHHPVAGLDAAGPRTPLAQLHRQRLLVGQAQGHLHVGAHERQPLHLGQRHRLACAPVLPASAPCSASPRAGGRRRAPAAPSEAPSGAGTDSASAPHGGPAVGHPPAQHVGPAHERGHERRGRAIVDLAGAADLLDPALVHHHDGIRKLHRLVLIVRDQDGGDRRVVGVAPGGTRGTAAATRAATPAPTRPAPRTARPAAAGAARPPAPGRTPPAGAGRPTARPAGGRRSRAAPPPPAARPPDGRSRPARRRLCPR